MAESVDALLRSASRSGATGAAALEGEGTAEGGAGSGSITELRRYDPSGRMAVAFESQRAAERALRAAALLAAGGEPVNPWGQGLHHAGMEGGGEAVAGAWLADLLHASLLRCAAGVSSG